MIEEHLRKTGMKLTELAALIPCDAGYLSRIASGKQKAGPNTDPA